MRFDIVTIFPDFFREAFDYGIIRRARAAGLVEIKAHDLRSWTTDKHHMVDDRPFGGGDGMVLKPEPIFAAVEALTGANTRASYPPRTRVVLLSPQGKVLTQAVAESFASDADHLVSVIVELDRLTDDVLIFAKAALPKVITQHGHGMSAGGAVVVLC